MLEISVPFDASDAKEKIISKSNFPHSSFPRSLTRFCVDFDPGGNKGVLLPGWKSNCHIARAEK